MARKNPELKVPENEDAEAEQAAAEVEAAAEKTLQDRIRALEAENKLLKEQRGGGTPFGGKTDYERVQEACKKAAAEGVDPWSVKISVKSPRRPAKEDPWYWLNTNNKSVQIPANDRYFDLALPWAETLVNMIKADWAAQDFQDNLEVFDPVTNPHRT